MGAAQLSFGVRCSGAGHVINEVALCSDEIAFVFLNDKFCRGLPHNLVYTGWLFQKSAAPQFDPISSSECKALPFFVETFKALGA